MLGYQVEGLIGAERCADESPAEAGVGVVTLSHVGLLNGAVNDLVETSLLHRSGRNGAGPDAKKRWMVGLG